VVNPSETIKTRLTESAEVKRQVAETCVDTILKAAKSIEESFRAGGKLLICGNGGSAADSQHMATELVSRLTAGFERPGLPAIALTTDTSFLTAFANDVSFEGIFERQVQALGKPGDVLFAISTSGNSTNVILAMKIAKQLNVKTIALCGNGGRMASIADVAISVPNGNTQYIQESHLAIEHILCELVENSMFRQEQVLPE